MIGKIRTEFTNIMELKNHQIKSEGYKFLWVTDFPLFEADEDGKLSTTHHPFTAPNPEDAKYLTNDPLKVCIRPYN